MDGREIHVVVAKENRKTPNEMRRAHPPPRDRSRDRRSRDRGDRGRRTDDRDRRSRDRERRSRSRDRGDRRRYNMTSREKINQDAI